jgi:hypothetical protein
LIPSDSKGDSIQNIIARNLMSKRRQFPGQNRSVTVEVNSEATEHRCCPQAPGFIDVVVGFRLWLEACASVTAPLGS